MVFSTRTLAIGATGLVAVVVGTVGYARAHPTLALTPPAVYGLDPAAAPDDLTLTSDNSVQGRRVSATFSSAPIGRVLEWLSKQDANFVVASSSYPSDLKITLNVKDEPLSTVEHAIAVAMGGSWVNRDGIMIFTKTGGFGANPYVISDLFGGKEFNTFKPLKSGGNSPFQLWTGPDSKAFEFNSKDWEKIQKDFGPDFQKKMQDQFGPEFQKRIQKDFGPDFQKKMQDQFGPEFQKRIQKDFGPEFQKKMQDKGGWITFGDGKAGNMFILHNQDLTGLMKSLTREQRATMKRRGFLTPKDLDAKQLKMLGEMKGKFEVKVQSDKDSMTIKSE